jgi:two-component system chemotaxis response regulator CheB
MQGRSCTRNHLKCPPLQLRRCSAGARVQSQMEEFSVIVIGASTGGLTPVRTIAEALPSHCKAAIGVTVHVGPYPSFIPEILNWHGKVPADFGRDGEVFTAERIYVAPPDCHMLFQEPDLIRLDRGAKVHSTRPAIDPMFASAARLYGRRVVGVVLSGNGQDGAAGLSLIRHEGGLALTQDPAEARDPRMPAAAIAADDPQLLPVTEIARRVVAFCAAR